MQRSGKIRWLPSPHAIVHRRPLRRASACHAQKRATPAEMAFENASHGKRDSNVERRTLGELAIAALRGQEGRCLVPTLFTAAIS